MLDLILSLSLFTLLILTFLGDLLQYAVRIIVSVLDHPNLTPHMVTLSMLINRFGAALGLLIIGVMLDTGTTVEKLALIYTVFLYCLAVIYYITSQNSKLCTRLLTTFMECYYKVQVEAPKSYVQTKSNIRKNYDISAIFCIAVLAFLIPSLLAANAPDYRASLLQSGFFLNSFATLYSALKIDRRMVLILNNKSKPRKLRIYRNFMQARAIGATMAATIILVIYYIHIF